MELFEFISLLNKRKQTILIIALLTLLLAMVFTLVQPLKYRSNLKVLVIQNFSANTDPYTASKSNEYLSNVLARVIYSSSFYANILESDFNIDKKYFSGSVEKQMKKWAKTIDAKVINDSGIIDISVYHTNRSQAELIAKSIGWTLQTKHTLYHGGGDNVKVEIIDEPITSKFLVKPNIVLNLFLGLIIGLLLAFSYIYLFPEEQFDVVKLFEKKNKIQHNKHKSLLTKNNLQRENLQREEESFKKEFIIFDKEDDNNSEISLKNDNKENNLLLNIDNNLVKQAIKEKFIGNGNMKNIFGKSHLDN